ncbi:MAG: hypothetical protein P4L98_17695 [Ancalomicrobiaceae bacterium]|nr:hypothetical protein [Ancalomicrobiaceae bacterium]
MLLVRLLLALVLAVGLLPTHGGAMAASAMPHQSHAVTASAEPCAEPCLTPDQGQSRHDQTPQDHCLVVMGACCMASMPDAAGAIIHPARAETAWVPIGSGLPTGLGYPPATPPPRV